MTETFVLSAAAVGLWVFFLWQRAPATTLFFSLLVGQILTTEVSGELYQNIGGLVVINSLEEMQVVLLLAPLVLTLIFLRHKIPRHKFVVEAIPMAFMVAALAVFVYPYAPAIQNVLEDLTNHRVETLKNIIVGGASITSLISAWFVYPGHKSTRKHKS